MQTSAEALGSSQNTHGYDYTLMATSGYTSLEQNAIKQAACLSLPTDTTNAQASNASQEAKRQICFDFTKNQCSRGANCKFSHDLNLIIQVNSQEKGICFDFLKGTCSRGPLCRFSHDLRNLQANSPTCTSVGSFASPQTDLISALNRQNTPICYDFVKSQCTRGSECKYSHDYSSIASTPRQAGKNPYVMCMDFVRGRCTRGASCRYAHFDPLQIAAAAAAAGGGGGAGYGNNAAGIQQAAMLNNNSMMNINSLAGLTPQQAQALLAAAAAAVAGGGGGGFNQQQQSFLPGADGIDPNSWPLQQEQQQQQNSGLVTSPQLEDDFALSLLQLQQLTLQNSTANTMNLNSIASTAEDVGPLPLPLSQQQQQQSPNDVSALSILLLQQQQQQQQQRHQQDQFIRAHRHQQQQHQQQRRPSNLGPSALPATINNSSTNAAAHGGVTTPATVGSLPLQPTDLNQEQQQEQQQQQQQGWSVPFHHPLLQKVQSADLRGTSMRPGSGNATVMNTNTHGSSNGVGGGSGSGGGGSINFSIGGTALGGSSYGGSISGTDSPTIRAAWGSLGAHAGSININSSVVSSSSAPTSQPSSVGAGSPMTDGVGTAQYIQQQLQQQQQQQHGQAQHAQQEYQSQPGLDVLKSIWSK